jgi:hypothetical protein
LRNRPIVFFPKDRRIRDSAFFEDVSVDCDMRTTA